MNEELETLSTARKIGLLGDTHGDFEHLFRVAASMRRRRVSVLVILGDFGFVWPRENWSETLDEIAKRLAANGQSLYFVDGNHEWHSKLLEFPIGDDGLRWLRPNVAHIPRGYRTTLLSGRILAALGGANSIDYFLRSVGYSWWLEESITDDDLELLGSDPVDVLIGHDAPLGVPSLDAVLDATAGYWPAEALEYAAFGRAKFHQGFLQARPRLYAGGHYHLHVDQTVQYEEDNDAFESRVVILAKNGSDVAISQAVLDVYTLGLQFLTRDDDRVDELTGNEGGLWRVTTRDSVHIFDLQKGTVERFPGETATAYVEDAPRRLREITTCRVGARGYWTFKSYDFMTDYFWASTSEIQAIERIPNDKQ
jgi:hypothetical protein